MRPLFALISLIALALPAARAEDTVPKHGISLFGDFKYGPDFTHFDYANPDAPKGGHGQARDARDLRQFQSLHPARGKRRSASASYSTR